MAPQRDVLPVVGAEQIAHASDPLAHAFGEQALRPQDQHRQQHDVRGDFLEAGGQVVAGELLDDADDDAADQRSRGCCRSRRCTAAANALMPRKPMFTSIIDTGDSRMPATAATPALIAQISEKIVRTGMPM